MSMTSCWRRWIWFHCPVVGKVEMSPGMTRWRLLLGTKLMISRSLGLLSSGETCSPLFSTPKMPASTCRPL